MRPCNIKNKNAFNSQLDKRAALLGSRLGISHEITKKATETEVNFRPSTPKHKNSAFKAAMTLWSSINKKWPNTIQKPRTRNIDNSATFTIPMTDEQFDKMKKVEMGDPTLFQLSPIEKTERNRKLEETLKELLVHNKIPLIDLNTYKEEYEIRTEQLIDVVGLADLTNRVIAWSTRKADGKTLPEEVGHFLEAMLKQTEENNWKKLMNGRDDRNILHIEKTKTWRDNYQRYLEKYEGDTILAKREVVGKLFGDFITEKFKKDELDKLGPIRKYLVRAIDKIVSIFSKKDVDTLPNAVTEIFEGEVTQFFDGRLIETAENTVFAGGIDTKNAIDSILDSALSAHMNRQKQIKIEQNRLKGEVKKRYNTLKSKHNIEAIFDTIKVYENKKLKTPEDQEIIEELYELLKLDELNTKEQQDIVTLIRLNKEIFKTEDLIKKKQEELALKYFISGVPKKNTKTTEGGLKNDMIDVMRDINKMKNGEKELDHIIFGKLKEFHGYYTPIIQKIQGFYSQRGTFEGINNKAFKKEIALLAKQLNEVKLFLEDEQKAQTIKLLDSMNRTESGEVIDPNFIAEEAVRDGEYFDLLGIEYHAGAAQHVANPIVQAYIVTAANIQNKVHRLTRSKGSEIFSKVQALKKKISIKNPEKTLMERDQDGKPTGYLINNYILGGENGFLETKERDHEAILDSVEKFAKTLGIDILLPRGAQNYERRRGILLGDEILELNLGPKERRAEIAKMKKVRKHYQKLRYNWDLKNTKLIEIPNAEDIFKKQATKEEYNKARVDALAASIDPSVAFSWSVALIIHQRQSEMSELEFNQWADRNIKVNPFGGIYYSGELITPSEKYRNKTYTKLKSDSNWAEFRNVYFDGLKDSNNNLPQFYSNTYSNRYLLPQISKSTLDVLVRSKSVFKEFKEFRKDLFDLFTSGIQGKSDDDIYATDFEVVKGDQSIYKNAPIRYNKLMPDPSLLSEDVFSSLIAYYEMSENFVATNDNLKTIDFLNHSVANSKYKVAFGNGLKDGVESNTLKFINALTNIQIYGESTKPQTFKIGDTEIDVAKMSGKVVQWIRDKNLLANYPAIFTGFIQAHLKENIIEQAIGVNTTRESSNFARAEVFKNAGSIVSEFNSPVKTNKLNIFVDKIGLRSNREIFDNLDKNRLLRNSIRVAYYGAWGLSDFIPKSEAYVAVADNYRLIDGKWYTKAQFQGSNEEWKANQPNSFYNLLEIKDNDLVSDKITDEQWNIVQNKAKRLGSNLDTQPLDVDRAVIDREFWGKYLTLHRSWMAQGLQRRFKRQHFNYLTQQEEVGYYNGAWTAFRQIIATRQLLTDFKGLGQRWAELSPAEKEGTLRMGYDLAALHVAYLLGYILNGIASDDEDNPLMQLAAYISTRLVLENMAFFSISEFGDVVNRPVAGVDFIGTVVEMIEQTIAYINIWDEVEEKEIKRGPYEGKTHLQRNIIKSLPWVRGIYETFPVDTPITSPAEALKGKNTYVKNKVINRTPFSVLAPVRSVVGEIKDAGKEE